MIDAMNESDKDFWDGVMNFSRTPRFRGIKRTVNGTIVSMVGFDDWSGNCVTIHVWSKKGLTRRFISECFKYVFTHVGVVIAPVRCNNAPSLELVRRLGFRELAVIKDGWTLGTDLAIQEMRRETCRWISQEV